MQTKRFNISLLVVLAVLWVFGAYVSAEDTAKININTASADQLAQLKGVGESYAAKIVEYREKNGPFKTPEDLMKVPGVGPKTFEANKDVITIEE